MEKWRYSLKSAQDNVVVENNSLSVVVRGGKLIAEGCAKVAACRNEAIKKGLAFLVGAGAAATVLEKLSPSDQQYVMAVAMNGGHADAVAQLTPEQRAAYDYIVQQDKQGSFQLLLAQQSSSGDKPASTPNIGKDLSDADKAEIGGIGSGREHLSLKKKIRNRKVIHLSRN